jgi:hypothetical protein
MQANGAEMLRLACRFAIKDGVEICAPVKSFCQKVFCLLDVLQPCGAIVRIQRT